MSPAMFEAAINEICTTNSPDILRSEGLKLMQKALGLNSPAYLPAIDIFCRRLRELKPRKQFGPPRKDSIGVPVGNGGAL